MKELLSKKVDDLIEKSEGKGRSAQLERAVVSLDPKWRGAKPFVGGISGCYLWLLGATKIPEPDKDKK